MCVCVHACKSGRGREHERERETDRQKQRRKIPSRLCIVSTEPNLGLELMNREIMTSAKIKSWLLNRLRHPGAPAFKSFLRSLLGEGELP